MPAVRPLSLGRLLNETFNIYRRNFLLFLGISAIPNGALLLILILFDKTLGTIRDGVGILGFPGIAFHDSCHSACSFYRYRRHRVRGIGYLSGADHQHQKLLFSGLGQGA
jgi:hypothetical protein